MSAVELAARSQVHIRGDTVHFIDGKTGRTCKGKVSWVPTHHNTKYGVLFSRQGNLIDGGIEAYRLWTTPLERLTGVGIDIGTSSTRVAHSCMGSTDTLTLPGRPAACPPAVVPCRRAPAWGMRTLLLHLQRRRQRGIRTIAQQRVFIRLMGLRSDDCVSGQDFRRHHREAWAAFTELARAKSNAELQSFIQLSGPCFGNQH